MIKTKKPPEAKITESIPDQLICESCGKEFSCGANIGECWCFAVEVKAETLAELRENFKNCLCQICILKTESGNQ